MSTKSKHTPKKGGGRGKEHSKKHRVIVEESSPSPPSTSSTFTLPKVADLPCYSDILRRTEEQGVAMEDLDTLQLELETLLSSAVVSSRTMMEEVRSLGNEKKSKSKELSKSVKRKEGQSPVSAKFTRAKPTTDHVLPDPSKLEAPKTLLPKNDMPNKFWSSVEPYCADITPEDLALLDDLIREHDHDEEYQKIPPLGQHYSLRLAKEETRGEQDVASNRVKSRSGESPSGRRRESSVIGPLTQRLVSSLVEENVTTPPKDTSRSRNSGSENASPSSYNHSQSASIEKRVRHELQAQGLLDSVEESEEDEILAEMKRCQKELKILSAQNLQQLKLLKKLAMEETGRQDLKKKLREVDDEIVEVFHRIQSCKLKKIPVNKKDQELAWQLLGNREALLKQIDF